MDPDWTARIIGTAQGPWIADRRPGNLAGRPIPPTQRRADLPSSPQAGIARLSLGVQALDDAALKALGRNHGADEARRAMGLAARAFPRLSIDLIYARPGQRPGAWAAGT